MHNYEPVVSADRIGAAQPVPQNSQIHLKRIGLSPFVAVLYAYCAGGPFGFEAMVSTSGPGLALIFILVVPVLFSVPIALATAELSSAMPVEGGFYRWTRSALGDFWGFQCGWWNWTGTFLMSGAYGVMLADYIGQVTPFRSRFSHWLVAVGLLGIVAYLNIRGIRLVGKLTLMLLLLALIPVAIFTYIGFSHARFHPFQPVIATGKSWHEVFGVGLALALWIYSGYEQMSTVTEEVEDPARNFPLGLAIVVPLAVITFALPVAAGLTALGNWQQWETGYIVTAARLVAGAWLEGAIFVAAAVCTFVLLDSTVLSGTRVPFTMSEDGYLHRSLASLSDRFGTPVVAILLSVAVCSILALATLTQLIAIYAWFRVSTSVLTLISFWRLRSLKPALSRRFKVPGGKMAAAAMVILPTLLFAWALCNSESSAALWGIAGLALGPAIYRLGPGRCQKRSPTHFRETPRS
jgi:amino acid transporter